MRLNSKHTVEELERYIHMCLKDGISIKELRETFGLLSAMKDAPDSFVIILFSLRWKCQKDRPFSH